MFKQSSAREPNPLTLVDPFTRLTTIPTRPITGNLRTTRTNVNHERPMTAKFFESAGNSTAATFKMRATSAFKTSKSAFLLLILAF